MLNLSNKISSFFARNPTSDSEAQPDSLPVAESNINVIAFDEEQPKPIPRYLQLARSIHERITADEEKELAVFRAAEALAEKAALVIASSRRACGLVFWTELSRRTLALFGWSSARKSSARQARPNGPPVAPGIPCALSRTSLGIGLGTPGPTVEHLRDRPPSTKKTDQPVKATLKKLISKVPVEGGWVVLSVVRSVVCR